MTSHKVAIYRDPTLSYPSRPPFHPPTDFPEYIFRGRGATDPQNQVYAAVRQALALLGLDEAHFETPAWNPLGEIIRPGDRVVIKPNFVRHFHGDGLSIESLVTHASVIRAALDYVSLALDGQGSIIIGDAPLQQGDWAEIVHLTHIGEVCDFYRQQATIPVELVDFRQEMAIKDPSGLVVQRLRLDRDPVKNVAVQLGEQSYLKEVASRYRRFRVTNYAPREMLRHHRPGRHEYLIAREVLEADVVLCLPKLKTHRKVGITCCLKNMVGINASKDWLPHHTVGSPPHNGDQYRHPSWRKRAVSWLLDRIEAPACPPATTRLLALAKAAIWKTDALVPFKDTYFEGSWYGNDTIWRTVLDLNRVLYYADAEGHLHWGQPQRRYFALVDAVTAGEGEGPTHPIPRSVGAIVAGLHPVAVDALCSLLMGFDIERIPLIREAIQRRTLGEATWQLASNHWPDEESLAREHLRFLPPAGWQGHVELARQETPTILR